MRNPLASALIFVTLSLPAYSKTDLSTAIPNDLAIGCNEALASGQDARPFVEEMLRRADLPLEKISAYRAMQCINTVKGDRYLYEDRQFVNVTLRLAQQQQAREKRLAVKQQDRESEAQLKLATLEREQAYIGAVLKVCVDEYNRDRFRALTTRICGDFFKARGLPE